MALAASLLLLLTLEFLVRVLHEPPVVNSHMISDSLLGYRMRRNIDWTARDESGSFPYRLNSQSFPGPELPSASAPPPAGGRILLIGDSYLNPWLIRDEDWVGNVLRAELAARGPAPEVYALACDDYGTGQELLLLRRHGERVAPTTVVLLLYAGNDVINNSQGLAGRTTVSPGDYFRPYLVDEGEGELVRRYALPWRARLRHSRLFAIAEARWLRRFGVASELQAELSGERELSLDERVQAGRLPEEHFELLRAPAPGGAWERAWRETEVLLLAFQRDVAALGARFVVVLIPSMLQVEDDSLVVLYDDALRRAGSPPLSATLDWNWPEQHLETVFHRAGIEHVMLLAPLRRELEQNGPAVHRKDGHMNGRGQALMGRRLAARLAPDAPDECFVAEESSRPVELERLYPVDALELDLAARPCFELIGWGWERWSPAGPPGPGWITHGTGLVLAPNRTGTLRLRGVLAPGSHLPVTLVVSRSLGPELLRRELEGAGEFELSVPVQAVPEHDDEWIALALAGQQSSSEAATLVLTGMSFRP
ncbi:MAG: hypothetical protein HOP15_16095 [Planctomycetes bacterium]|nr:hypothetical protein [Planctomycetota bacterium]